ncbi:MAG: AbrB/MazE/SpoVT family DNA-binding domain-containing protein [archaeon]
MRLQQLKNGTYVVSLPSQIVRAKGWKKKDTLEVEIDKQGNLTLKKKAQE